MKYIAALFFYLLSFLGYAQNKTEGSELISVNDLKEDLAILKSNLKAVHPGLYAYINEEAFDLSFAQTEKAITKPMSDIEFYRLLAPLQSKIQNGHTMIIPSENWSNIKDTQKALFPFEVHLQDERLYVLKNLSTNELIANGTEIKSINGESAESIISALTNSITQDGNNNTFPLHLLQIGFNQWYADIKGTPASFELELAPNNQQPYIISIAALTLEKINENHLSRYNEEKVPWYLKEDKRSLSLKIENGIATLIVPTFDSSAESSDGKKYNRFYEEAFKQIRSAEIQHVIVDLRDNGGGDPRPQLSLLTHLIDEPLKLYKRTYAVTRKIPNPELYKNDKTGWLNFLLKLALRERNGVYEETGNLPARMYGAPRRKPVSPSKDLYQGELYVLTNGGSFSATGEVAGLLKNFNRGIFIGEETGGSDYQNSSGIMIMLYLPHSQTRINLPLLCFELNVNFANDALGAIPDYTIRKSITDVLMQKDPVLKQALDLIGNTSK